MKRGFSIVLDIVIMSQSGLASPAKELPDWWMDSHLYYVLPNRIYFFLGAQVTDSEGEDEWYALCRAIYASAQWRQA